MPPCNTSADRGNGASAHVQRARYCRWCLTSRNALPNVPHRCLRELRTSLLLTSTRPAFRHRIVRVVKRGSEKQMIRINASAVISTRTVVANQQPIGDGSIGQFPRHAWRACLYPCMPLKRSIATSVKSTLPEPARIGFEYLRPKTLSKGRAGLIAT